MACKYYRQHSLFGNKTNRSKWSYTWFCCVILYCATFNEAFRMGNKWAQSIYEKIIEKEMYTTSSLAVEGGVYCTKHTGFIK